MLVAQLDLAARDLEAASAPAPAAAEVQADLAFYLDLARDPEHVASLPHGWADETLVWRRRWLARLIERVDLVCTRRGVVDVVTRFRDGSTLGERLVTRILRDDDQAELLRQLWADPARPAVGWSAWITARMAAEGFPRSEAGTCRALTAALGESGRRLQIEALGRPTPAFRAPVRAIAPAEMELVRQLWADPRRPSWGHMVWLRGELAAAGYERSVDVIRYMVKRAHEGQVTKPKAPPAPAANIAELELARRLWASPARPARGYLAWMQTELAAAGYLRTRDQVRGLTRRPGIRNADAVTPGCP